MKRCVRHAQGSRRYGGVGDAGRGEGAVGGMRGREDVGEGAGPLLAAW